MRRGSWRSPKYGEFHLKAYESAGMGESGNREVDRILRLGASSRRALEDRLRTGFATVARTDKGGLEMTEIRFNSTAKPNSRPNGRTVGERFSDGTAPGSLSESRGKSARELLERVLYYKTHDMGVAVFPLVVGSVELPPEVGAQPVERHVHSRPETHLEIRLLARHFPGYHRNTS